MESSHFLAVTSPWPLYKTLFFDFWFRPPNAQNLLPKICTQLPLNLLVWQIDRRCLRLPGGFRGWPIQWNHAKCCGANPCCHGNEIWARHGDPVAHRLVRLSVSGSLSWSHAHATVKPGRWSAIVIWSTPVSVIVHCSLAAECWPDLWIPSTAGAESLCADEFNTIQYNTMRVFSAPYTRHRTGRHYNSHRMCVE